MYNKVTSQRSTWIKEYYLFSSIFFLDKSNIEDTKQWRQSAGGLAPGHMLKGLKYLRKTAWEISCIELRRFPLSVLIYCSFQYNSENNTFFGTSLTIQSRPIWYFCNIILGLQSNIVTVTGMVCQHVFKAVLHKNK